MMLKLAFRTQLPQEMGGGGGKVAWIGRYRVTHCAALRSNADVHDCIQILKEHSDLRD